MHFKDHFSDRATDYAQYRPRYPKALFEYLASLALDRQCAWDCATGNGQAATGLADFFDRVIATDASEKQIESAHRHDRVTYRVARAEQSGLENSIVDLVTVAQALHWLPIDEFFREAQRVLKPGGIVAVWCYNLFEVSPQIDALIEHFYRDVVGPHWNPERRLVETSYCTVTFPFEEIAVPNFEMKADWSLDHLLGYVRTWSASRRFLAARGFDPVTELSDELAILWGDAALAKTIRWPLSARVGRASS
jgi:SAM-dependent methyltransferase